MTIEIDEPAVIVWRPRLEPDARQLHGRDQVAPRRVRPVLDRRQLRLRRLPGHGPLADACDLFRHIRMLNAAEEAAREAVTTGNDCGRACGGVHTSQVDLFSPRYYETAINAWLEELRPQAA